MMGIRKWCAAITPSIDRIGGSGMMGIRKIAVVCIIAAALLANVPTMAYANTYNNVNSGSDYITSSTTLLFTNPHGSFNLRAWVTKSGWFVSDRYSIKMYDRAGRLLWSANNQNDRVYYIGGNVTKIVIERSSWQGAVTRWQRK